MHSSISTVPRQLQKCVASAVVVIIRGASFPQNHLQPADCYVVGLFGDQSHAAAVVDGYVFDQYTGRGGRVDRRRMPVLGEDAFECQDRSDGR